MNLLQVKITCLLVTISIYVHMHQRKESESVSNLREEESSLHKTSETPRCTHQQAHGLKEEEEDKRAGTVTWRLYWDYFKQGLPVTIIVISAVLMVSAQGKSTRNIFLL